jgi:hypothetical protein
VKKKSAFQSAFFNPRALLAFAFCAVGSVLAALGFTANPGTANWSIITSPNTSATLPNSLDGVTCASASDCWAVGYYQNGNGVVEPLIEHWNGSSWAIVASPNASGTFNQLNRVACASASDCWAVGYSYYSTSDLSQTLIEHWDGSAWTIVASPNTSATEKNALFGVTCASSTECWAVGAYGNGDTAQTLIEEWNGSAWSIVTSPNTPFRQAGVTQVNILFGVTCVSTSNCWAVGYSFTDYSVGVGGNFMTSPQTLIEQWNGNSWTIVASPSISGNNYLQDVTCTSATECWAVGYSNNGNASQKSGINQTLIEEWNGSAWTIVTSPNTSATQMNYLLGVTCASASECWAVGYYEESTNSIRQTLVEQWDGTSWTIASSPNTTATLHNYLLGVTCTPASECWAVGEYDVHTLVEGFGANPGTAGWSIITSPNTSAIQPNSLDGVTCTSATDCWAVGYYQNYNEVVEPLIEHWDGSSWAIVASPNASGTINQLSRVACTSVSDCWAVGYTYNSSISGLFKTLIEHWDGSSWSIIASPNTSVTERNVLVGVTCASASECWAVGAYGNGDTGQTLIEHWDGSAWSIVTSPNTSFTQAGIAQVNVLQGVTCASTSDCWAVGYSFTHYDLTVGPTNSAFVTAPQTLIEHWNGTSWSIVTSPSIPGNNYLKDVTCTSVSECWAVGYSNNGNAAQQGGINQTLIEEWNGSAWIILISPNTSAAQPNSLDGVTCASASECWAVGSYGENTTGIRQTLVEQWDGTSWSIASSPNTTAMQDNYLLGVTCASASECWAVGYFFDSTSGLSGTLIEESSAAIQH